MQITSYIDKEALQLITMMFAEIVNFERDV